MALLNHWSFRINRVLRHICDVPRNFETSPLQPLLRKLYPVGNAIGKRLVVEVVAWVMQSCGVAIADEDEGAGALLQHVGEVFARHGRIDIGIDIIGADHVAGNFRCIVGFCRMIDGYGTVAVILRFRFSAVGKSDALGNLADPRFRHVTHVFIECPHRAGDQRLVGNDVVAGAGLEARDRNDNRAQGIGIAGGDQL